MKDNFKKSIVDYLSSEIEVVNSPTSGKQWTLVNLEDSFRLLFNLLEYQISYTDLDRLAESFENNMSLIISGNLNEFPDAIERIASNYESLLKKIAYLKYKDTPVWDGSSASKGLKGTMFFDLCNGNIDGRPKLDIPEPLVDNTGVKKEILDFVRINLRNAVHISKTYRRQDLIPFSNLVLSCYLFTVLDNKNYLKRIFYPEYKYLDKVVSSKTLNGLEKVYVELLGQDSNEKIDITGKQIKDEFHLLSEIEKYTHEETETIDEEEVYIDNITNIIKDNKNLLLIGAPGSGKSTTLKRILYSNSHKILDGNESIKFPFYIEANELRTANETFKGILDAKLDQALITFLLEKGKIQVLIDGINEITSEFKANAVNEIKSLISKYPNSSFIITDRKYNYTKNIGVSVFELRDLEESRIKEFIVKNTSGKSDHIWQSISENPEMLALASNPLMLKMYLSVLSFGKIPSNRGQLYDLFVKAVFAREEQKKEQFDKDLKKGILSEVAYNMRINGSVSADKSYFMKLVGSAINNHNYHIADILFQKEVLDNNVIKESGNNEISFLHETYQEYFCALHLKNGFLKDGVVHIDPIDPGWLEPLLLCNDLFERESEQLKFFEFLFVGQHEKEAPKTITDFIKEDYNLNIHIACKVANRHKELNDIVYKRAETFLGNHLVLSRAYFLKEKDFPIPIKTLFNAVSSLSSRILLEKIFVNSLWVEQWLYGTIDEENYKNKIVKKDPYHEEHFKQIARAIIDNSTDFFPLLNAVSSAEHEYRLVKPVISKLRSFKRNLFQSIPLKKLIEYFEVVDFDIDIFINILKQDPSVITKYSFEVYGKDVNMRVLETLSKFHHLKLEIRELVINELKNNIYRTSYYWKITKLFFDNNHFDSFLILCEYFYSKGFDVVNDMIPLLQRIPYDILPNLLKGVFVENPETSIIEYEDYVSRGDEVFLTIDSFYSDICASLIKNEDSILINNRYEMTPYKLEPVLNVTEYILTAKPNDPIEIKVSDKGGSIEYQSQSSTINFDYSYFKPSSKGDKINFSIGPVGFSQPSIKVGDEIVIDEKTKMSFVSFSTRNKETVRHKMVSRDINKNIPINGFLNLGIAHIDYSKPSRYHPDQLKTVLLIEKINAELVSNNSSISVVDEFVKDVGLSYVFYDKLNNVKFGVVVSFYRNSVNVYEIASRSFKEISCTESELSHLQVNSAVIIENSGYLTFFDHRKSDFNFGFIESHIIEMFDDRREGFIRNYDNNSFDYNDYFFHFDNCSFLPKIGDSVRFIPSLNPSRNYQNQPVALLIDKVENPRCTIVDIVQGDQEENLRGIAIDVVSGEELFFSISDAVHYDMEVTSSTKLDKRQTFDYLVHKKAKGQSKKHIKLIKNN